MKFMLHVDEGVNDLAFTLACEARDIEGIPEELVQAALVDTFQVVNKDAGYTAFRLAFPRPAETTPDLRGLLATRPGPQDDPAVALADAVATAAAAATPEQLRAALAALGVPVPPPATPAEWEAFYADEWEPEPAPAAPPAPAPADPLAAARALCR